MESPSIGVGIVQRVESLWIVSATEHRDRCPDTGERRATCDEKHESETDEDATIVGAVTRSTATQPPRGGSVAVACGVLHIALW